jgi:hypothetical protein
MVCNSAYPKKNLELQEQEKTKNNRTRAGKSVQKEGVKP